MGTLRSTLTGIIVGSAVLAVLWYNYRDRFAVDLTQFRTSQSCVESVNKSEIKTLAAFEEKAVSVISGTNPAEASSSTVNQSHIDSWKPSLESISLLFDTNALVNLGIARLRQSIAENQQTNPESLVNTQKTKLSKLFTTARTWCDTLPSVAN